MPKRLTLQDIARTLDLHYSTVSLALRDDPRLNKATRLRVQTAARELGYAPNPNARALAVWKQTSRPASEHGTLAILTPRIFPSVYLEGAQEQAARLGYQAEMISYREPAVSGARLTQILRARGITGLLVIPPFPGDPVLKRLNLDWRYFSAITFGNTLLWPKLHRVGDNQFRNMKQLVRKLVSLGYRRVGFCMSDYASIALASDDGWKGGYLVEMDRVGEAISLFYRERDTYDERLIRNWIKSERLDVIVTDYSYAAERVALCSGRKVPEELGIASLTAGDDPSSDIGSCSGINPHFSRIGAMAVDFVVHLIHTHQRGIPEFPRRILLEGTWVEGKPTAA